MEHGNLSIIFYRGRTAPLFRMRLNLKVSKIDVAMAALAKSISVTIAGSGGDMWQKEGEEETKTRHFELTLKHTGRQS